jgi:large subunit ribosomal protein L23
MPTLYTVIRRPLITEKGMTVKETQNTLVFEVALKATKTEVKQAVESLFKIKVDGARSGGGVSSPATGPTGRRLTFA